MQITVSSYQWMLMGLALAMAALGVSWISRRG